MPYKYKKKIRNHCQKTLNLLVQHGNKIEREIQSGREGVVQDDEGDIDDITESVEDEINWDSESNESIENDENADADVDEHEEEPTNNIKEDIANWSLKFNISHEAISALLVILQKSNPNLPKDARTLLKTPKNAQIIPIRGGEYVSLGVQDVLSKYIPNCSKIGNKVNININIDGLPISKSSAMQVWPILIQLEGQETVLPVSIYCGYTKGLKRIFGTFYK